MSRQGWLWSSSRRWVLLSAVMYVGMQAGCRPAAAPPAVIDDHDDHDHDDHDHAGHDHDGEIDVDGLVPIEDAPPFESLGEGVHQLVALRDAIAKGFADNDVESIHDQLHDVAGVLGQIEDMIPETDIPDDTKQEMEQAVDTLFNAYGELDAKQHGDEGKDYAEVSGEINTAIDTLTKNSLS